MNSIPLIVVYIRIKMSRETLRKRFRNCIDNKGAVEVKIRQGTLIALCNENQR
jgi:hypothetical protein